jgi:hypothetical protein
MFVLHEYLVLPPEKSTKQMLSDKAPQKTAQGRMGFALLP